MIGDASDGKGGDRPKTPVVFSRPPSGFFELRLGVVGNGIILRPADSREWIFLDEQEKAIARPSRMAWEGRLSLCERFF